MLRAHSPRPLLAALLLALPSAGVACILQELVYEGRKCVDNSQCAGGTSCDPVTFKCVRPPPSDALPELAIDLGPREQGPDVVDQAVAPPSDATRDKPKTDKPPTKIDLKKDLPHDFYKPPDKPVGPCSPACTGTTPVCCKKPGATTSSCVASIAECGCDPASGDPCSGSPYPVCCISSGADPRCQANASGCQCNPTSGNPCFGAYSTCCKKGTDPTARCYADSTGCLP